MLDALVKGLLLGFFLALSVGPVIFTIIKQSLNNGREGGFSFITGVWISDIVLVVVSNAFSEWVSTALEYKKSIGYIGSLFLMGVGIFFVFFKRVNLGKGADGKKLRFRKRDFLKIFVSGFLLNTLNPSVLLFWLVNATAFATTHSFRERVLIFTTCLVVNMIADVLKVLLAGKIRNKLTVRNLSIINKISGSILIVFAFALLYGIVFLSEQLPGN
ncbi:MAG TPA: LysE family transporter [Chitinophagaceae bacterium]|jgi:threonine/homoserine/homoserine lactone efflux protein|nr:LysE family transporter [Chitinophagaceae bacterium]